MLAAFLPSTYAKKILPRSCYHYGRWIAYFFWFTVGIFVLRKTKQATLAVRYVKTNGRLVALDFIESNPDFADFIANFEKKFPRPPAIFLLNQYALNMTHNFLCNTKIFKGVHERFVFVTLDETARNDLKKYWPEISQIYLPTPSLYMPFSFAEGPYQLIYIVRANIAVALIKRKKSFWMMQQDTFWREDFFSLKLEDSELGGQVLFDQIGDDSSSNRAEWVNGANFFIRASNDTLKFFDSVAAKLGHWYAPDMGIMIHQCQTWERPKCRYIPHKIAHSWEWMYTDQVDPPFLMQLDCETSGSSKLQQLAKYGFNFTMRDGRTCNPDAVRRVQHLMEEGAIDVGTPTRLSWGKFQFKVYWWMVDYLLSTPIIGNLMKPYLPLLGYILMFTL